MSTIVLAERPRVVIVGPAIDHVAVVRVRGELAMLGVDVDVVVQGKETIDLEAIAHRMGASAALRVESSPSAIVLWVDPSARAGGPAEVRVAGVAEERDPGLLALRAVEVLRARLLKVPVAPAPTVDAAPDVDVDVPDAGAEPVVVDAGLPVVPTKTERSHPFAINAGPAILITPSMPVGFDVRLGAEWDPIPRLGIETSAFIPATAGSVSAAEGSMDVRVYGIGGGLRGVVTDPVFSDFSFALGAGLHAMMISFAGKAQDPWMSNSGTRWAAAPYAAATAGYRFNSRFALRLDVMASLVRPEVILQIAGHELATFGQPVIFPSVSLEVRP